MIDTNGKLIKTIIGYDANALYLWCIMQEMPTGVLRYEEFTEEKDINSLLNTTYGFYLIDIHVPDDRYNDFCEFPPIFRNVYLKDNSRKLISCTNAKEILIYHPLLTWYIEHGLVVSKVYGMIHCNRYKCFKKFGEIVSDARRQGDIKDEFKIIGGEMKDVGNTAYGRTSMNKMKHTATSYSDYKTTRRKINSPYFVDCDEYGDTYEVSMKKGIIKQNIAIHISTAILQYAKMRLLQFYYDFLCKYVDKSDFQMMYCDTDSLYMGVTGDKLDDLIKPKMKEEYEKDKFNWLPRNDTEANAMYDKRTPGLFKVEFEGSAMVALAPKLYYVQGLSNKDKFSCKGTSKKNNVSLLNMKNFKKVLEDNDIVYIENTGMRYINHNVVWYSQTKKGLTTRYDKRKVLEDKITTWPLDTQEYSTSKFIKANSI